MGKHKRKLAERNLWRENSRERRFGRWFLWPLRVFADLNLKFAGLVLMGQIGMGIRFDIANNSLGPQQVYM